MIYIGIDPGVNGGIAKIYVDDGLVVADRMPATREDVVDYFRGFMPGTVAYIERPPISMGKRVTASALVKLGHSYERCATAAVSRGIEIVEVTPQQWQKLYGFKRSGRTPTEWKNLLKRKAIELFPNIKVTLAIADALLIANYARRVHV